MTFCCDKMACRHLDLKNQISSFSVYKWTKTCKLGDIKQAVYKILHSTSVRICTWTHRHWQSQPKNNNASVLNKIPFITNNITSSLFFGKNLIVGNDWILTSSSSLAVASIFATTTSERSLNFSPSSSQIGASCLQWPHHGASRTTTSQTLWFIYPPMTHMTKVTKNRQQTGNQPGKLRPRTVCILKHYRVTIQAV